MILGVISLIIGIIIFIYHISINVSSAPQQTVQYLGFVCASIFLMGGIILIKLNEMKIINQKSNSNSNVLKEE